MADPEPEPIPTLTLPDYAHQAGCPCARVETFRVRRPQGLDPAVVVRCVECGAQAVEDDTTTREEGDDARH